MSSNNFPYRLRQRPGPENALGQVKIMFPNKHDVYLHDTPTKQLFSRVERAFSSGCVRVANVMLLTEWLLTDMAGWNRDKINTVLISGKETRVNLQLKIPVHILYFTAVADQSGELRLLSDIYQRDQLLIAALDNHSLKAGGK
ncbi:MAG: L,D-transpeptidase family protein [Gammaproteobacteria bacterium]|nr:L,D-transpeptidase family protein [Gammaproteobacteria bacterium]